MSDGRRRHGFDDDAETRALLRSPPSAQALAWAAESLGTEVEHWQVLRGGMSSAMYALTLRGSSTDAVLRCYVRPELNEEEPDLATREAAALRVAARAEIPTPTLLAVDPDGARVGIPAILMTRLPGRVVWDAKGVLRWLRRLAEALPAVHAVDIGADEVGVYFNYQQESYAPPAWAHKPVVWEKAVELFHGPVLDEDRCFIHRDYHPGNVLWQRGAVTGLVDWQSACVGPPSVDVGHCRANLLRYAPQLADEFTALTEHALGRPFHPWADIAALIGMLDGLRLTPPPAVGRSAIEAAIERAVSELS